MKWTLILMSLSAGALIVSACEPAPAPWTSDSPSGYVDAVIGGFGGELRITGWAGDRNTEEPINVVFYVNGDLVPGATLANESRPDVHDNGSHRTHARNLDVTTGLRRSTQLGTSSG